MSRGLGQGELMVPAPSKTVIVPRGHGAIWGVDPSTVRVAIATVTADGVRGVSTRSFAGRPGGERLVGVRAGTRALVEMLVEVEERPGLIVLEQPSGKTPNLQLVYAVGVIFEALVRYGEAPVETVTSSQWKKVACGYGAIYKPQKKPGFAAPPPEAYAVLPWARENGYVGSSWDEADAWGICEYGRRTFGLVQR